MLEIYPYLAAAFLGGFSIAVLYLDRRSSWEANEKDPVAPGTKFKMVVLVNMELKMGKGKIAAQVGHAVLGCYQQALTTAPSAVRWWERLGQAKIALQCPTQIEMHAVKAAAEARGFPTCLVRDAGHTQVASGSRTCLAIGPAPDASFRDLTGHFKLL